MTTFRWFAANVISSSAESRSAMASPRTMRNAKSTNSRAPMSRTKSPSKRPLPPNVSAARGANHLHAAVTKNRRSKSSRSRSGGSVLTTSDPLTLGSHPQYRLPNRKITHNLFHGRVRIQPAPELDVLWLRERQPRKKQARLPHRPLIEILHIRRERPTLLVGHEWKHVFHGFSDAAPVSGFKRPKIVLRCGKNLARRSHRVQIKQAIAVRFRSRQLQGKAAVGGNLVWCQHGCEPLPAKTRQFRVSGIPRKFRHLRDPASPMIIFRFAFLDSMRRSCHPAQIPA